MLDEPLKALLAFAKKTDLQEVVWEKKGTLISFRRRTPGRIVVTPQRGQEPLEVPLDDGAALAPVYLRSTMVGTFYRSDSPERPPLVVEGTAVVPGQPVAAIEAMKIMKDVLAPMPCRIKKALVDNGHPVEYGQPLFEIEPEEGHV